MDLQHILGKEILDLDPTFIFLNITLDITAIVLKHISWIILNGIVKHQEFSDIIRKWFLYPFDSTIFIPSKTGDIR